MTRAEDEEIARALSREREAIPAGVWLKILYTATLVAAVFPLGVAAMSGWVGLTLGTSLMGSFLLPLLAVVVWRVYGVWRHPTTLMRHRAGAVIALLRGVAVVEMMVGCLAALVLFLQRPIIQAMGGVRTDDGIEYYLLQLGAVMVGGLGLQGVLLFEWSRVVGLEKFYREAAPHETTQTEPQVVILLNVCTLVLVMASWIVGSLTTLSINPGVSSLVVFGLTRTLPTALMMVLRIASLIGHRTNIPMAYVAGPLLFVRRLAVAGLPVYLLAATANLAIRAGAGTWAGALGTLASYAPLLGVLVIAAMEVSRLLAYERHERDVAGGLRR